MEMGDIEKVRGISAQIALLNSDEKERLAKVSRLVPRCIAVVVIVNARNQLLVDPGRDAVKQESFYRLLGGGVSFGEHSSEAVVREIAEELGQRIVVERYLGTLENVFVFQAEKGHEIIMVYQASFSDRSVYEQERIRVSDQGRAPSVAVWRSIEEIRQEGAKLYPEGLEGLLGSLHATHIFANR